jgi:endonuclease/exonuclease/phosphatase family metal-dependent hydrolase
MTDEPDITDPPPEVLARLSELGTQLDHVIPAKQLDRNLLIGTWNLRAFGGLTKKWLPGENDTPKRNLADIRYIGAILSRFDVVAVQEVRDDLRALRHMLKALGPDWGFILTDVTMGRAGNNERLAFLFDTRRVKPSGLACELVLPPEEQATDTPSGVVRAQFARTPYGVSFISSEKTFILVTLHIIYGESSSDRVAELKAIAEWLANWADEVNNWGHNLIALGDFNIDRLGDPLYEAFTSTGLTPAPQLNEVPRTIFDDPARTHFYDQIAWFVDEEKGPMLSLRSTAAGSFDFVQELLGEMTKVELSWRISDHYPLWAEFAVQQS